MGGTIVAGRLAEKYPSRLRSLERRVAVIEYALVIPAIIRLALSLRDERIRRKTKRYVGSDIPEATPPGVDHKEVLTRALWSALWGASAALTAQGVDLTNLTTWETALGAGVASALSAIKNYVKEYREGKTFRATSEFASEPEDAGGDV